jgi:phosphosulfolactate synthase
MSLSNIRLEELLRVEIYRRAIHSDVFGKVNLKPLPTTADGERRPE